MTNNEPMVISASNISVGASKYHITVTDRGALLRRMPLGLHKYDKATNLVVATSNGTPVWRKEAIVESQQLFYFDSSNAATKYAMTS
jgi:hypothetical protein